MLPRREMVLGASTMDRVGLADHGPWAHPRGRSADGTGPRHRTAPARPLERGSRERTHRGGRPRAGLFGRGGRLGGADARAAARRP